MGATARHIQLLFAGGIILSTFFEWALVSTRHPAMIYFWFTGRLNLSKIEKILVLPALTISIVAGFAQTGIDYGSMTAAPKHICLAIHILATFSLWWMATDVPTQQKAQRDVKKWYDQLDVTKEVLPNGSSLPRVLYWRRFSNVMSCMFVLALYGLMTLKPGYAVP